MDRDIVLIDEAKAELNISSRLFISKPEAVIAKVRTAITKLNEALKILERK